jgi:hypothetical protein
MAARSNPQLLSVPEVSALEMRWASEGGHLRSRWIATSQRNRPQPAEVKLGPRLSAVSRGPTSVKAEASWLAGMICWLVAFLL